MINLRTVLKLLADIEKWYPYILSVVVIISIVLWVPEHISSKFFQVRVVEAVLSISGILFGFLITVLTLLLQATSKSLQAIKDVNRFDELVSYNKQAVYNTIIVMTSSLLFLIIVDEPYILLKYAFLGFNICHLWLFLVICMVLNTYRYTRIFYVLIKS